MAQTGHFLDDTSDYADVFLPATTFLEEEDVMASYGHNYLGPVNPAIARRGRVPLRVPDVFDLAARFPFAARFRKSERDWLAILCAPIKAQGGDMEHLRRGPFRLDAPMVPYADKTFKTPSGKFQFMTDFAPEAWPRAMPATPTALC